MPDRPAELGELAKNIVDNWYAGCPITLHTGEVVIRELVARVPEEKAALIAAVQRLAADAYAAGVAAGREEAAVQAEQYHREHDGDE
jgi:hypothetical protein